MTKNQDNIDVLITTFRPGVIAPGFFVPSLGNAAKGERTIPFTKEIL